MPAEYWRDDDGDGVDDSSGMTERQWNEQSQGGRRFSDRDGDGLDDDTRLDVNAWTQRFAGENGENTQRRAQQQQQEGYDRATEEYDQYVASGQRQADLDAGRRPRQDPRAGDGRGDGGSGGGSGGGGVSDFDRDSADIPVWGWLSGASGRRDAAAAQTEADRARALWDGLDDYQYGPEDLAVDYEEEAYVKGPASAQLGNAQADAGSIEAQRDALRAMQEVYQQGGMTAADRARHLQSRQMAGQQMRATREADTAQLQSRGMGGSGQAIASMLGAQQQGATSLSMQDASMLQDAQRRALQAMQSASGAAGQMRGQSFGEDTTRRGAIDDFNRWNTEREQGWTGRNTNRRNQSRESMAQARRDYYEQQERKVAGKTNQWQSAAGGARQDQQRRDQQDQAGAGAVGGVLEAIIS